MWFYLLVSMAYCKYYIVRYFSCSHCILHVCRGHSLLSLFYWLLCWDFQHLQLFILSLFGTTPQILNSWQYFTTLY